MKKSKNVEATQLPKEDLWSITEGLINMSSGFDDARGEELNKLSHKIVSERPTEKEMKEYIRKGMTILDDMLKVSRALEILYQILPEHGLDTYSRKLILDRRKTAYAVATDVLAKNFVRGGIPIAMVKEEKFPEILAYDHSEVLASIMKEELEKDDMDRESDTEEIERLVKEDGDITIDEMTDREKKLWARALRKDKQMLEAIVKDASKNLKDINKDLEQLERK